MWLCERCGASTPNECTCRKQAVDGEAMTDTGRWQPIETAPKDGSDVLLARRGVHRVLIGSWYSNEWRVGGHATSVTHWMPLPAPPEAR